MNEANCGNCGSPLQVENYMYCENCGALNAVRTSEEGIVCDTHTENRAIGFCVVCGKAVCDECVETSGNRILCGDPNHRAYLDDWKLIQKFDFEYEAAMLYANLEQHDIETEVFSKPNPDTTESALRPTIVEVLVPKAKFEQAVEVAKTLGLTDEGYSEDQRGED